MQARQTYPSPSKLLVAQHYIDGAFRESSDGKAFDVFDPATNTRIAEAAAGSDADVALAVSSARRAFDNGPWPRLPASERASALRRVAELIRTNANDLIELECRDIGMPIAQMRGLAARAAENFDFFASSIEQLHGRSFQVASRFVNYTLHKPVGVAALIMPWNAPLMLSTWRIAPALAAGNTVVLKPAEWSPLSSSKLAEIVSEADIPPGVFNVVHGFGETTGAALSQHEGVDLVCFTGETTTGKVIMAAASRTLKRVSFELGGKSPFLVFDDADLDHALDAATFQIFSMNGQRCTAGSRLLLQRDIYDDFTNAMAARAVNVRCGDPFDEKTELGPLIHPEHLARVLEFVDGAETEEARVLAGGSRPPGLESGNYLAATVVADAAQGSRLFQEEIFGPVVVATPFDDESDAVQLANATRYGLASYVFTSDVHKAHRVANAIDAGLCWINSHNVRDLRTPFGGVKQSGIGREGGDYSFEFYCDTSTVHVSLEPPPVPRMGVDRS